MGAGQLNALGRHVALVGFMGAGKTTFGRDAAGRLGRAFLDLDRAIEERAGKPIPELFAERGEAEFRRLEEHAARVALAAPEPAVISLGGGAVTSAADARAARVGVRRPDRDRRRRGLGAREALQAAARPRRGRVPAAATPTRAPLYREVADAVAADAAGDRARRGRRPLRARRRSTGSASSFRARARSRSSPTAP